MDPNSANISMEAMLMYMAYFSKFQALGIPPLQPGQSPDFKFLPTTPKFSPKVNNQSSKPLIEWFEANIHHPYPTEEDMSNFKMLTGYTDKQLCDWFRNRRRTYKKKQSKDGQVPWNIPPQSSRKRRASSLTYSSSDTASSTTTALSPLPSSSTPSSTTALSPDSSYCSHSETSSEDSTCDTSNQSLLQPVKAEPVSPVSSPAKSSNESSIVVPLKKARLSMNDNA